MALFDLRRRGGRIRAFVCILLIAGVASAWVLRLPLFAGNFAEVDPGRLYRSAQPGPDDWPRLLATARPASVLNLRGGWRGDPWYAAEFALQAKNVDVYDFPMDAKRRPTRRELLTLLDLFDRCRYPLLIHCKSGSDRTGLAVGLYLMDREGLPPEEAGRALTIAHGHVPMFGPQRMNDPFREYADWLRAEGIAHSSEALRRFLATAYRTDDPYDGPEPVTLIPGPRYQGPDGTRLRVEDAVRR